MSPFRITGFLSLAAAVGISVAEAQDSCISCLHMRAARLMCARVAATSGQQRAQLLDAMQQSVNTARSMGNTEPFSCNPPPEPNPAPGVNPPSPPNGAPPTPSDPAGRLIATLRSLLSLIPQRGEAESAELESRETFEQLVMKLQEELRRVEPNVERRRELWERIQAGLNGDPGGAEGSDPTDRSPEANVDRRRALWEKSQKQITPFEVQFKVKDPEGKLVGRTIWRENDRWYCSQVAADGVGQEAACRFPPGDAWAKYTFSFRELKNP